jgi:hypothetical protein
VPDEGFGGGYPRNYLLGIIDDRDAAIELVSGLQANDIDDVQLIEGQRGVDMLDSDGTKHGLFGTLRRAIEHQFAEVDHLSQYEEAVRGGSVVVAVYAEDEPMRQRATELLQARDARFVNYFGAMAVELLVR